VKLFIYAVASQVEAQISPLQMVMAADLGTARAKVLELGIHPDDLWIMEFPKGH